MSREIEVGLSSGWESPIGSPGMIMSDHMGSLAGTGYTPLVSLCEMYSPGVAFFANVVCGHHWSRGSWFLPHVRQTPAL